MRPPVMLRLQSGATALALLRSLTVLQGYPAVVSGVDCLCHASLRLCCVALTLLAVENAIAKKGDSDDVRAQDRAAVTACLAIAARAPKRSHAQARICSVPCALNCSSSRRTSAGVSSETSDCPLCMQWRRVLAPEHPPPRRAEGTEVSVEAADEDPGVGDGGRPVAPAADASPLTPRSFWTTRTRGRGESVRHVLHPSRSFCGRIPRGCSSPCRRRTASQTPDDRFSNSSGNAAHPSCPTWRNRPVC